MRTMTVAERRARLGQRHHLARQVPYGSSVEGAPGINDSRGILAVAADLVGLHASDPASVYLAARARVHNFRPEHLEAVLYERRSLVRMLGMRRTMFVVPRDLAAIMDAACTQALAPAERRRLVGFLEDQGLATDGTTWLQDVEVRTLAAIARRGEATANELTQEVPELRLKLRFGEGKAWGGTFGLSTRVLFLLATEARIVRGRPLGTWLSSQYRWVVTSSWLGHELPPMEPDAARADLLRRWLATFGPGTLTDIRWWTGWTVAQAKKALARVGAVEVALAHGAGGDGGEGDGKGDSGGRAGAPSTAGWLLPDDLEPAMEVEPWAALLPGLDPTVMGWKERDWYLGAHQPLLFDRNGNAGPTVWWDGRVVGGWGQRADGEVVVRLLEDVGREAQARIDAEAERLAQWLGAVRIIPRFRTPLEKELAG